VQIIKSELLMFIKLSSHIFIVYHKIYFMKLKINFFYLLKTMGSLILITKTAMLNFYF